MTQVLLLSGHAEFGKTSTANILKRYFEKNNKKVCIIPYAKYLKFIAKEYFNWDGNKDIKGRDLLIDLGTNIVRSKNKNFWVDAVINFFEVFNDFFDVFIIDDCRYPNEIEEWNNHNIPVVTVRIIRKNFESCLTQEQKNSISETSLDNYNFDYVIESESGLDKLEIEVKRFISEYFNMEA